MTDRDEWIVLTGLEADLAVYAGETVTEGGITYGGTLSRARDSGKVRIHTGTLPPVVIFDPNAPSPGGSATPCTFSDISGQSLPIVTNYGMAYVINGVARIFGSITYPGSGGGSQTAAVSLPIPIPNHCHVAGLSINEAANPNLLAVAGFKNTSNLGIFLLGTTLQATNAQCMGATLDFSIEYPVA